MVPPFFYCMKKAYLSFFLLCAALMINAQESVKFSLRPDGSFLSEDGKSYTVVEYEGKTAQELYSLIKSNIITLFNSPKTVLSENEPINLSIRALSEDLYKTYKAGGGFVTYKVYYNLVFHFKDGRIRVDAPTVDRNLEVYATGIPLPKTFVSLVDGWFDKNGKAKSNRVKYIENVENNINYPINYLLGNKKETPFIEEDNW